MVLIGSGGTSASAPLPWRTAVTAEGRSYSAASSAPIRSSRSEPSSWRLIMMITPAAAISEASSITESHPARSLASSARPCAMVRTSTASSPRPPSMVAAEPSLALFHASRSTEKPPLDLRSVLSKTITPSIWLRCTIAGTWSCSARRFCQCLATPELASLILDSSRAREPERLSSVGASSEPSRSPDSTSACWSRTSSVRLSRSVSAVAVLEIWGSATLVVSARSSASAARTAWL